jgi:hypothetical protein
MPNSSALLSAKAIDVPEHEPLIITTLITGLRGSTQPKLILCNDGRPYVLKMHSNPTGVNTLANEAIGAALLQGLGFNAPRTRMVLIDQSTLECHPTLVLVGQDGRSYRPKLGLHFASEYAEGFVVQGDRRAMTQSPDFVGVGLFDVWAAHSDTRQYVRRYDHETKKLESLFIDNSCIFGGPDWEPERLTGYSLQRQLSDFDNEPRYRRQIPLLITHFQRLLPDLLKRAIASTPSEWFAGDIAALETHLLCRLSNLESLVSEALSPNSLRLLLTLSARDCSYTDSR